MVVGDGEEFLPTPASAASLPYPVSLPPLQSPPPPCNPLFSPANSGLWPRRHQDTALGKQSPLLSQIATYAASRNHGAVNSA
uniref:Uncharacterized protein n=1 Tax=Leersia perrieri TaxID=77586 RepID=A0A0D9XVJ2_9ORYZ